MANACLGNHVDLRISDLCSTINKKIAIILVWIIKKLFYAWYFCNTSGTRTGSEAS